MVAYSFNRRFEQPILSGIKLQTIRANRKRHARPGEELQLFVGMRTRHCQFLIAPICRHVLPVRLVLSREHGPVSFEVDGVRLLTSDMTRFAEEDGFGEACDPALDMCQFWFQQHGKGKTEIDFRGVLIAWHSLGGLL